MSQEISIRPYTPKQLAGIYGVSVRTLHRWLAPFHAQIGTRNGHFYNVNQVRMIFSKLGIPNDKEPSGS